MSKIIKITAFFLFFVMCFCVKNAFAIREINPDFEPILKFWPTLAECQANCIGICTEVPGFILDGTAQPSTWTCEEGIDVEPNLPDFPIWESCGTSGTTQSKYTASGCTYETESRECCSNGNWSGWNENCPKTCNNADKPETTRSCTGSNGKTGTQSRSVTCDTTTGKWTTGTWGTCITPECTSGQTRTCPSDSSKIQTCTSSGTWGTCTTPKECTSGQTRTCPSNSSKIQTCTSSGTWSSTCSCKNEGNGMIYCQGMIRPSNQNCAHGIWSNETCSGICCCGDDTPKLKSNGSPGCWGYNIAGTMQSWQPSCGCTMKNTRL